MDESVCYECNQSLFLVVLEEVLLKPYVFLDAAVHAWRIFRELVLETRDDHVHLCVFAFPPAKELLDLPDVNVLVLFLGEVAPAWDGGYLKVNLRRESESMQSISRMRYS